MKAGLIILKPTKSRGQKLSDNLEVYCRSFVRSHKSNDLQEMTISSDKAWSTLIEIFDHIRNEEDNKRIDPKLTKMETSKIIENVDQNALTSIIASKKIAPINNPQPCSLRETLNKIAHFDKLNSTYRVTRSGAHYLVLSGLGKNAKAGPWVAEIHMSKLIKRCRQAIV